jgi:ABC-type uncharacterized transport system YnjBCD substrate-binding protein
MKAVLTFYLPKEKYEHHQAVNAWRYAKCLKDIWNKLWELKKYGERNNSISTADIRKLVIDIFNENDINYDEL